jgi:hypothetical protein
VARDCLHTTMWFPLGGNVVVFRSLKQASFKAVAASAEPRQQKKTKIAQGPASQRNRQRVGPSAIDLTHDSVVRLL